MLRLATTLRNHLLLAIAISPTAAFGAWGPDVRLTQEGSPSYTNGQSLAAGAAGLRAVVWQDARDGNGEIYLKRSTDGGGTWSPDRNLSADPAGQLWPCVAVSGTTVHVVWKDWRTGLSQVRYARSTDGGVTFAAAVQVSMNPTQEINGVYPALAVFGPDVHVAWTEERGGNYDVRYRRSTDAGVTWLPDVRLTTDAAMQGFIGKAIAASGNQVLVAWVDYRDGNPEVYARASSDRGASWGHDVRLSNDPDASYVDSVTVAGADVNVFWTNSGAGGFDLRCRHSGDGASTFGPELMLTGSGTALHTSASAAGRHVMMVWEDERAGSDDVYFRESMDGGATFGADVALSSDPGRSTGASVASDDRAISVVWHDDRDGNEEVYGKQDGRWPLADVASGRGHAVASPNEVVVHDASGARRVSFLAYAAGTWGVNVGADDLDGLPVDEIVTGPGPGSVFGPQGRAFRRDGTPIAKVSFYAYGPLKFGLEVAAGSIDGDADAEIVTGPGPGAVFGPHVRAFTYGGTQLSVVPRVSFYAYGTLRYGARPASGDLDADAFAEILTGPGPGVVFGPQVRGWNYDGATVSAMAKVNFNAFSTTQYGVVVSSGDLRGDASLDILSSPGPGATAGFEARARGYELDASGVSALPGCDVVAFPTFYGASISAADLGKDRADDLAIAPGPDPAAATDVAAYAYDGAGLAIIGSTYQAFPGGSYGAIVAGARLDY
ncbi:MAG: exo-alpha-sialidase [Acidobacteriota bacterium]